MAMGLVTSAIMIGCLIGALLGGRYSDKHRRKNMMMISAVALILSAVGWCSASNVAWLIAARFLGGCGMGVLSAVIPIYISEISPAKWRVNVCLVLPVIHRYRDSCCLLCRLRDDFVGKQLALDARIAVVVCCGNLLMLLFLPESPRWLIRQGEYEVARRAIARMGISAEDAAVMLKHRNLRRRAAPNLCQLFRGSTAYIVLLGSLLAVFQQITGINVIINYAPEILRQTGIGGDTALMQAIYVGTVASLFTIVAVWLVDRLGRKKLLLWGCAGLVVSLAYLTYAFAAATRQYRYSDCPACLHRFLCSVAFPAYVCRYSRNISIGDPGTAMALSTGISWACAFLVVQFFPVMLESFGAAIVFAGFGILCLAAWLFIYIWIPETKGVRSKKLKNNC